VVVARGSVAEWAARYPRHPYYAPLTLAPTAQGVELARGIAGGLVAEHVALVRRLRRAILEIEAPADRSARLEAIEALAWEDLETEDRAACPPLLLLGDEAALLEQGFELVTRLLASELPVKIVMLDGRGRLEAGAEPALVAMAHRRAFVLAASLAHPAHLAGGLLDALAWPGPALVHLHTPSPARHGFAVDAALERARLAVEGRAHVLFRYDPSAEGQFGPGERRTSRNGPRERAASHSTSSRSNRTGRPRWPPCWPTGWHLPRRTGEARHPPSRWESRLSPSGIAWPGRRPSAWPSGSA
jgi:pyruvate-ferredoxin/flavodoxin oxidoreductase